MTKRLLLFLICLFPFITQAQITYQADDFIEIGDTARYSILLVGLDTINVASTGSSFHWDFANLSANSQVLEEYISPATTGYQTSWCVSSGNLANCQSAFTDLTNLAFIASDSLSIGDFAVNDVARHYKKSADSYSEAMIGITTLGIPFTFEYEKKDTVLRFPLQFDQQDSAESRLVIDLNNVGVELVHTSSQKRTNVVDGWGSLTTPLQHYPNVLRMRTVIERKDTTFLEAGDVIVDTMLVEYQWFSEGVPTPVMQALGVIVDGQEEINRIRYLDQFRCFEPQARFAFQPLMPVYDSTSRSATVNFTNLSSNADAFQWDFGDGSSSTAQNPDHTYLCADEYTVQLIANNTCNTAISDTFQLSFTIDDTSIFLPDTLTTSICPNDSLLIDGTYVSTPGFYTDSLSSVNGCDSLRIIELKLLDISRPDTIPTNICFGDSVLIDGTFESIAGFYPDSLMAINGCDSVIIVDLAVIDLDNSVTIKPDTLSANQANATYQWIDCSNNTAISTATSQTFLPDVDGSYAVRIESEGCTVQSDCISFTISALADDLLAHELRVFPNPFSKQITIESKEGVHFHQVRVFSSTGKLIQEQVLSPTSAATLSLDVEAGSYLLQLIFVDGSSRVVKLLK